MSEPSDVITPTETNSVWAEPTATRPTLAHNAPRAQPAMGLGPAASTHLPLPPITLL